MGRDVNFVNGNGVVVEIEYANGGTKQGFLCELLKNGWVGIVDSYLDVENTDINDYGISFKVYDGGIEVLFDEDLLVLADIEDDYLFETDYKLVRLYLKK